MPPKKKHNKEDMWQHSKAKMLLQHALMSGDIPLDSCAMSPSAVYRARPEFSQFPYTTFRDNLRSLRKKIKQDKGMASIESSALAHDCLIFPKKTHDRRGAQVWDGSKAQQFLRQDMADGKYDDGMQPKDLPVQHTKRV